MDKIFIGIDFGHGETSVSRVPGANGESISRIPLTKSGAYGGKTVFSAICRNQKGEWRFVRSEDDFLSSDIQQAFKGKIEDLNNDQKVALREFAKLVFKTILTNDTDLRYNPETGESNFVICIACPTGWRKPGDSRIPDEYLNFFVKEAGIPIRFCINESDAAFYRKYKDYAPSDTVFVIDFGSSTIDFTTYHNSAIVRDCCWTRENGAHKIEDVIVDYGYTNKTNGGKNRSNVLDIDAIRTGGKLKDTHHAISLGARMEKEKFFSYEMERYDLDLKFAKLIPDYNGDRTDVAFSVRLKKDEFFNLINTYVKSLKDTFSAAAKKLNGCGIYPNKLVISGGANRMPFVVDLIKESFPSVVKEHIFVDNEPEWVVSDGAAKYTAAHWNALKDRDKLQDEFSSWAKQNLDKKLRCVTISTFNQVLKEELHSGLEIKYLNGSDGSLNALEGAAKEILESMPKTDKFKTTAKSRFVAVVDDFIKKKLEDIIYKNYGKKVSINENFIDPGDTFENVIAGTDTLHSKIKDSAYEALISVLFKSLLNWDANRSYNGRKKLMNAYIDKCDYKICNHNIDLNKFIEEAVGKIDRILHDNGLFQISD